MKFMKGSLDFSEIDMLKQCSKQVLQTESKRTKVESKLSLKYGAFILLMEIDHDSPFQASASSASSVEDDDPELLELLSGLDFPHLAKQTLHAASAVFSLTSQTHSTL